MLFGELLKKVQNLKRTANCTDKFDSKPIFLSDDITHLTSIIYSVTLPELPLENDCRRAFLVTISKQRPDGKDHKNAIEQPGPGAWIR